MHAFSLFHKPLEHRMIFDKQSGSFLVIIRVRSCINSSDDLPQTLKYSSYTSIEAWIEKQWLHVDHIVLDSITTGLRISLSICYLCIPMRSKIYISFDNISFFQDRCPSDSLVFSYTLHRYIESINMESVIITSTISVLKAESSSTLSTLYAEIYKCVNTMYTLGHLPANGLI